MVTGLDMNWGNKVMMIKFAKGLRKISFLFIRNVHLREKINSLLHRIIQSKVSAILKNKKFEFVTEKKILSQNIKHVWVLWLQGEEHAPPLVKACIASIKRHVPEDYTVTVISESNISEYITLPEHILTKYASGEITRTHFSDILRWALLAVYGGLWMDSTIYLTKTLSLENPNGFLTLKTPAEEDAKYISKGRWSIFFIGVPEGYAPAKEMMNRLYRYWITENKLVDYFLVDYILDGIVSSNSELRRDIENNKNFTNNMYFLQDNVESDMTPLLSDKIHAINPGVFKMNYKFNFAKNLSSESVLSLILAEEI